MEEGNASLKTLRSHSPSRGPRRSRPALACHPLLPLGPPYLRQSLTAVTFLLLAALFPPVVEGQTDAPRVETIAFTDGFK